MFKQEWPTTDCPGDDRKNPARSLVIGSCVATVWWSAGDQGGRGKSAACAVGNALVAYVTIVIQMFCPVGLAAYYPYPSGSALLVGEAAGACCC